MEVVTNWAMCWALSLLSEVCACPVHARVSLGIAWGRDVCALFLQHNKLGCATSLAEVLLVLQAALSPGLLGTLLLCDQFSAHHTAAASLGGKGWG